MFKYIYLIIFLCFFTTEINSKILYVSKAEGCDTNIGSFDKPFASISKAAAIALANDTVLIREGVYREHVSPMNSGFNSTQRITYMAYPNEKVVIKGSDIVHNWVFKEGVWLVALPNTYFHDFNPYQLTLFGDWLKKGEKYHLGEVYINGQPLTEKLTYQDLSAIKYTWYTIVDQDTTFIYANFGDQNPNHNLTEINVRPTCFYPKSIGINYITVKNITLEQAATQWAPPTGEQIGMIGPHWSKGWIIENCNIGYSKCVGISLGKERASGHNLWSLYGKDRNPLKYNKHGFSREIEVILRASEIGWSKEFVGSHQIVNNKIYNCGQAGIIGHLGAIYSKIVDNEIYNINLQDSYSGFETAGIKLHAAIDVIIEHNYIHKTIRGVWLDWQAQGVHFNRNIITESLEQDFFVEVAHGPLLVYNNLFLSKTNCLIDAQGIAFFNNLFLGDIKTRISPGRYTPYHFNHSTKVKGFFNNNGGDVRFYNNMFFSTTSHGGLASYNAYPTDNIFIEQQDLSLEESLNVKFPIWTGCNIYTNLTSPYKYEKYYIYEDGTVKVKEDNYGYYLDWNINEEKLKGYESKGINTRMLGVAITSESAFENIDGTEFVLNTDFYRNKRNEKKPMIGPFESLIHNYIWMKR